MRPRTRILAHSLRDRFPALVALQGINTIALLVSALKACASSRQLESGKRIHADAMRSGEHRNAFVATTLISMYAKCGSMADSRKVFDAMAVRGVVAWTALVLGYAENGEARLALELFSRMEEPADGPAFVAAAMACAIAAVEEQGREIDGKVYKLWSLEKGMGLHSRAAKLGFDRSSSFLANTLLDLYAKCGSLVDSWRVFETIASPCVVSWTALIQGHVENGETQAGLELFDYVLGRKICEPNSRTYVAALLACAELAEKEDGTQVFLQETGKVAAVRLKSLERCFELHSQALERGFASDRFIENALVRLYSKSGSMADAFLVFQGMISPDVVSWTALILGYELNGDSEQALECFMQMERSDCRPDARTFTAALTASTTLAAFDAGRRIDALVTGQGLESEPFLSACLVDFYSKCGRVEAARYIFDSTAAVGVVHWGALMAGYGRQGESEEVITLFGRLVDEGLKPNAVVLLAVLSACSHAGLLEKGRKLFGSMKPVYGVQPGIEHYHAMIDLLGRSNHLDDAVTMITDMPYKPTVVTWRTLLGACWKMKNVAVGRMAFDSIMELDPGEVSAHILMSNIYGSLGMFVEKAKVRAMGGLDEEALEHESWNL
ncbi:pentatricopeptide repeat-containing protein At1g11290, chloroplastic-like [Selaginella moellendorffii]|uniref:pentatricopeptide repeat-containing protein At1g11290, chloroplastic-like n=1 Tax=Selaginella moellendorffii TaxID=88036 RepID=UPI000D1C8491|nr:pentatricopeptide repeat-containing protein At1g11290, chloroplastic-like [Selaginella moellendorffii]|eukprot:XP_024522736.1 pentatricopeptide repeat-containing protein At1g11290, chloroplastic-like [Selaginella moellendorffii]